MRLILKLFCHIGRKTSFPVQTSEISFYNAEIIKESKIRIGFFINFETGRRTYCIKCKNKCKQSYKIIIALCSKYKAKRGAKSDKNRHEYDNSG